MPRRVLVRSGLRRKERQVRVLQVEPREPLAKLMMARYYEASLGRFMTVDPSTKSIVLANPQSWSRYSYTLNNPLQYVDSTGKYPTGIHNQIIDKAFPGLSKDQRQVLKDSSKRVDKDQGTAGSYKHGMRAPGQSAEEASKKANDYVKTNEAKAQDQQKSHESSGGEGLSNEALSTFGNALHTVTDSQSPAHEGFQEWKGTESLGNKAEAVNHYLNEANPSEENLGQAVEAAQKAFKDTFGDEAAAAATKAPENDKTK